MKTVTRWLNILGYFFQSQKQGKIFINLYNKIIKYYVLILII